MVSEKFSRVLIYIGMFLILTFIVIFAWNEVFFEMAKKVQADKFGQLGDIIGGFVGSLWALAGVILFYVALSEQRIDFKNNQKALNAQIEALQIQSNEFKLQRKELQETRNIYIEQAKTQKLQQFESTFFNLLQLLHQIVRDITLQETKKDVAKLMNDAQEKEVNITGRRCFEILYNRLGKFYERHHQLDIFENEIDVVQSAYLDFYNRYQPIIGHYLMNLYYITKFIQEHAENIGLYTDMLRSQLSSHELLLLFYHILSNKDGKKLKQFVEEYQFLRGLLIEDLLSMEHKELYAETAY
jgi:hypothetical protein